MSHQIEKTLFGPPWPMDVDGLCDWLIEAVSPSKVADPIWLRELAESIWHFLNDEFVDETPSLARLQEEAIKLTRELGHPQLAESLRSSRFSSGDHSATQGWPRHLLAAQNLGLIHIDAMTTPTKRAGGWIDYAPGMDFDNVAWRENIVRANRQYHRFAIITDHQLFHGAATSETAVQRLKLALSATTLDLIVNLNWPSGREALHQVGCLFMDMARTDSNVIEADPLEIVQYRFWNPSDRRRLIWRWHLNESEFATAARQRLRHICDVAVREKNWQFALNRSKQPTWGTTGLTRDEPAIAQFISFNLRKFLRFAQTDREFASARLDVLDSLARIISDVATTHQRLLKEEPHHRELRRDVFVAVLTEYPSDITTDELIRIRDKLQSQFPTTLLGQSIQFRFQPTSENGRDVLDLRDIQGSKRGGFDSELPTDTVLVLVQPDHLLAGERLMHAVLDLFQSTQVRDLFVAGTFSDTKLDS